LRGWMSCEEGGRSPMWQHHAIAPKRHLVQRGTAKGQGGDANLMQHFLRRCAQFPYAMMPRTSHSEAQFDKKYFRSPQLGESEECKVPCHMALLFFRLGHHHPSAQALPSASLSARLAITLCSSSSSRPNNPQNNVQQPRDVQHSVADKAWPRRSSGATSRLLQA
jgi:hypothetical protein